MIGTRSFAGAHQMRAERTKVGLNLAGRIRVWAGRLMLICLLGGITVQALLGLRMWAQLTGQTVSEGILGFVYGATDFLVSPFEHYDTVQPIKQTGVFEVATLTAVEAYLIGVLAVLAVLFLFRLILSPFTKNYDEIDEVDAVEATSLRPAAETP
jgi:hypothetical protein